METKLFTFPPVNGLENETRPVYLLYGVDRTFSEHHVSDERLMKCLWQEMGAIAMQRKDSRFTANGSKVYWDDHGPEYAGPECKDPIESNTYFVANDEMYLRGLIEYGIQTSERLGRPLLLYYNRRNTDKNDNSWATHDSVSIANQYADRVMATTSALNRGVQETEAPATILIKHLLRSSFMTGAGAITSKGPRFGQKIDTVRNYSLYAFSSTLFRIDKLHGARFEARASDRSMLNAGNVLRVGSTVLVAALGQTPLAYHLNDKTPITSPRQGSSYNGIPLGLDRMFTPGVWTSQYIEAADMEQRFAEYAIEQLPNFMTVPVPYMTIAKEWYRYCEDFKAVVRRQAPIDILADRADWARKMGLVLDYWAQDPGKRTVTDDGAQKIDHQYALTSVKIHGRHGRATHGPGVQDRANLQLPFTPSRAAVTQAYETPPATRAAARVQRIQAGRHSGLEVRADWHAVKIGSSRRRLQPNYNYNYPDYQQKANP